LQKGMGSRARNRDSTSGERSFVGLFSERVLRPEGISIFIGGKIRYELTGPQVRKICKKVPQSYKFSPPGGNLKKKVDWGAVRGEGN